jgi:hypothetical protein
MKRICRFMRAHLGSEPSEKEWKIPLKPERRLSEKGSEER